MVGAYFKAHSNKSHKDKKIIKNISSPVFMQQLKNIKNNN